jgi:hypothetical protein
MRWVKRILLALPFAVAAVLNACLYAARPLHWRNEHIAGYCFLFAIPWAWLLDNGLPMLKPPWLGDFVDSIVFLVGSSAALLGVPLALVPYGSPSASQCQ